MKDKFFLLRTPEYLYRVTTTDDFKYDEEGYILAHNSNEKYDAKSIPACSDDLDLEYIARFLLSIGFLQRDHPFIILKLIVSQLCIIDMRLHPFFITPEYFIHAKVNSISEVLIGKWRVRDSVVKYTHSRSRRGMLKDQHIEPSRDVEFIIGEEVSDSKIFNYF